ncbi:MAG TPA: GAF domain-containing protein [Candidatus Baltobacteraceae bacterium]|jgi:hypothetical protein
MNASRSRVIVRTIFVVAFTLLGTVIEGSDLTLPWHPYGSFGFLMNGRSDVVVVSSGAARGLRVGDTVDVLRMTPADRYALGRDGLRVVEPGRVLEVPLTSGRVVTLTAQTRLRTTADNVSNVIEVLAMLSYLILAAVLVLIRPMPATWAFYAFSYTFCTFAATPNTWPFAIAVPAFALFTLAGALSPGAFVSFALRFPDANPRGAGALLERAALVIVTPFLAGVGLFDIFSYIFAGFASPPWLSTTANVLRVSGYAAGVAALIVRYFSAPADERNRLRWVACAFAVAFLPFLALRFAWTQELLTPDPITINLCQACAVFAPIALAYTVLKHRLFDIRLVVSRALMYTAMTSFIVGVLALVDWAFSKWLEQSRFATIVELALTLFLGAMMTTLHRRIEQLLNRVVFRSQVLAAAAIRRFAQETDLIADPQRLLSQTHDALRPRLEADYVALYTEDGASYALSTPRDPALPTILPADDFAVLRVRRWSEPFECDEPSHPLRGALFVPMVARTRLVGFIVCGPKRDRTHYLPEEVETLTMLSHRVASSYLWLTVVSTAPLLSSPPFESPA